MKKRDFKIAGAHRATVAAAATITGALDALIKARSELKGASVLEQPIKDAVEALGVLGYAGRALSQIRRDGIKPTVKAEFQGICDPEAPITPTMLFGDELVKRQRDLSTANRLNKPAGRPSPMGRGTFFRGRGASNANRGAPSFLASTPGYRGGSARGRRGRRH